MRKKKRSNLNEALERFDQKMHRIFGKSKTWYQIGWTCLLLAGVLYAGMYATSYSVNICYWPFVASTVSFMTAFVVATGRKTRRDYYRTIRDHVTGAN